MRRIGGRDQDMEEIYFRGNLYFQMFTKTPCKHPVIFLKDVSAQQMAILLKYMYLGQISVKKEVSAILKD